VKRSTSPWPWAQLEQHEAVELFGLTRADTALVEYRDDFPVGVVVEEAVNLLDDRRVGLAELPDPERARQLKGSCGAAAEADMGGDLLVPEQGDVVDHETV
jgi:hypothetical protein